MFIAALTVTTTAIALLIREQWRNLQAAQQQPAPARTPSRVRIIEPVYDWQHDQ